MSAIPSSFVRSAPPVPRVPPPRGFGGPCRPSTTPELESTTQPPIPTAYPAVAHRLTFLLEYADGSAELESGLSRVAPPTGSRPRSPGPASGSKDGSRPGTRSSPRAIPRNNLRYNDAPPMCSFTANVSSRRQRGGSMDRRTPIPPPARAPVPEAASPIAVRLHRARRWPDFPTPWVMEHCTAGPFEPDGAHGPTRNPTHPRAAPHRRPAPGASAARPVPALGPRAPPCYRPRHRLVADAAPALPRRTCP